MENITEDKPPSPYAFYNRIFVGILIGVRLCPSC